MRAGLITIVGVLLWGCGDTDSISGGEPASAGATRPADAGAGAGAQPVKFESVVGDQESGGVFGKCSYKVEIEGGETIKEFEVDVIGGKRGTKAAITIDGVEVGTIILDIEGEGDFELTEAGDIYFPEGFPQVKEGSIVKVGDILEFRLGTVAVLADLESTAQQGKLVATAKWKAENVGGRLVRKFKLEIEGAESGASLPVYIDGKHVADAKIGVGGTERVKLGDGEDPFPEGFTEPKAGSLIKIGDLLEFTLE